MNSSFVHSIPPSEQKGFTDGMEKVLQAVYSQAKQANTWGEYVTICKVLDEFRYDKQKFKAR